MYKVTSQALVCLSQHRRHFTVATHNQTWSLVKGVRGLASNIGQSIDLHAQVIIGEGGQSKNDVLYLHGLFGSGSNWRGVATAVTKACNVNSHLLDARNHGLSPHTSSMNYSLMAEDVHRYIQSKKITKCTILGHSMGGKVAMFLATTYPQLVDQLVIDDIAPVKYGKSHYEYHLDLLRKLKLLDLETTTSRIEADNECRKYIEDPMIRGFLLQNLVNDPLRPGYFKWRMNIDLLLDTLMDWADAWPDATNYQYFDKPTLFIAGGMSPYIKPNYEGIIIKMFPCSHIERIDGGSHYVHYEKQKKFLDIVVPFINKSTSSHYVGDSHML